MGQIALCIADSMGWELNAEDLALTTLKSVTGYHPTFSPDRNASGFFRHWLDMETGAQAWSSEYSTIDTEILVAGALFCAHYFRSDSISFYTDELWNSINHGSVIDDPVSGSLFREQDAAGNGILVAENFEWGLGAGSANFGFGYHADRIDDNPGNIVSPHIIAGFLPIYPGGK
ncbi:MAG: hypothetical protein ACI959_001539, partial [Limisphaerales bacterium]